MTNSKDNEEVFRKIADADEKGDKKEVERLIKEAKEKGNPEMIELQKESEERVRIEIEIVRLNQRIRFLINVQKGFNKLFYAGKIKKLQNTAVDHIFREEVPRKLHIDLFELLREIKAKKIFSIDENLYRKMEIVRNDYSHGNKTNNPAIIEEHPVVDEKDILEILTSLKEKILSVSHAKDIIEKHVPDTYSKSEVDNLIEFITGVKPDS